jgi:hypothetical protein
MTEIYGQTKTDKLAEENTLARQIVKEISQFGITDRQRYLIIYYLGLELENIEHVQELSGFIKHLVPDLTITGLYQGEE